MKNPALAAILSFVFPGLGQAYCGRIVRWLAIAFTFIALAIVSFFLSFVVIGILGWIVLFIFWVWNVFDAYSLASRAGMPAQATRSD